MFWTMLKWFFAPSSARAVAAPAPQPTPWLAKAKEHERAEDAVYSRGDFGPVLKQAVKKSQTPRKGRSKGPAVTRKPYVPMFDKEDVAAGSPVEVGDASDILLPVVVELATEIFSSGGDGGSGFADPSPDFSGGGGDFGGGGSNGDW